MSSACEDGNLLRCYCGRTALTTDTEVIIRLCLVGICVEHIACVATHTRNWTKNEEWGTKPYDSNSEAVTV